MKFYFVGICGIGMSAIAQALRSIGHEVAGSDRQIDPNGVNAKLIRYFEDIGVKIFPQNGSFIEKFIPDIIVYSTAIEKNNPDFKSAQDIQKIHRSEALRKVIESFPDKISIAVTGTNGKTSVSACLAYALSELGADPIALIGGKVANFAESPDAPGNFRKGNGKYIVFEADESDKSILNYSPDYAIILNTGPDHYPISEQNEVFAKFADSARKGLIIFDELLTQLNTRAKPSATFGENTNSPAKIHIGLKKYLPPKDSGKQFPEALIQFNSNEFKVKILPGIHNAINATAVIAALSVLNFEDRKIIKAIERFEGVERRFKICGRNKNGTLIIDDYAHNPDKIRACIRTAQEIAEGRVIFVFQPHGYGPLGFMKEDLKKRLQDCLRPQDRFIILPVYYAGGTTSFKPSSEEIAKEFKDCGIDGCEFRNSRNEVSELIDNEYNSKDIVVIAGARDETLSEWAKSIVRQ